MKSEIRLAVSRRSTVLCLCSLALRALALGLLPALGLGQTSDITYAFTTLASRASAGAEDGIGSAARFNSPQSVAVDRAGNVFVADTGNHTIRKITPARVVTTIAGRPGQPGSADGGGAAARFDFPYAIAIDGADNLYVADTGNHTIRKITPAGLVTTFAGAPGLTGLVDGLGAAARFNKPEGLAISPNGHLYVADSGNGAIRRISPTGAVTTLADGSSGLVGVRCLAVDSAEYVYSGSYNRIQKISPGGVVTALAGGGYGNNDGTGSAAGFYQLTGLVLDDTAVLWAADEYNIRRITPDGTVRTAAWSDTNYGGVNDAGSDSQFGPPVGLARDTVGMLYFTDIANTIHCMPAGSPAAAMLAGFPGQRSHGDGMGSNARFDLPTSVAVNGSGHVYVAEDWSIREITPEGAVSTLAGHFAYSPQDGTRFAAAFTHLDGITADRLGNLYAIDNWINGFVSIRKITMTGGIVTTVPAGWVGAYDPYTRITGIAADDSGNVFIAIPGKAIIQKVTAAGEVSTFAGSYGQWGTDDGTGEAARFGFPTALASDRDNNIYVLDTANSGSIRKISPAGVVTTIATGLTLNSEWPPVAPSKLYYSPPQTDSPRSIAIDDVGNIYLTYYYLHIIRRLSPSGAIATIGGAAGEAGSADGIGSAARFDGPEGIAVDHAGTIYLADALQGTIRMGISPATSMNVLWSVGENANGELGDGTTTDRSTPAQVAIGVRAMAAGLHHSLFLKVDGTLWTMGDNTYGQLGDGTTTSRFAPVQVATGVQAVAAGFNHSLFIKTDGTLWGMGYSGYGQLGDVSYPNTPVQITTGVQIVAAGGNQSFFVKTDGTLWGMGYNRMGQLGDGTAADRATPVQIATDVRAVAASNLHTLFSKTDGTLWGMGENSAGQLGSALSAITPIPLATNVQAVAAGQDHSLFLQTDGTLWAMGFNGYGQLGDGTTTSRNTPVRVATGVLAIAAGNSHSLFVKTDSTLWATGRNSSGQLGDGTTVTRFLSAQVAVGIQAVAAGGDHSLFITGGDPNTLPPIITAQPANRAVTSGQSAALAMAVESGPAVIYEWQRKAGGGTTWADLSDGAMYNGITTATLTISSVNASMNGDSFRCVVTNATGSVTSEVATLTVIGGTPLTITTFAGQPGIIGRENGTGSAAYFFAPADLAADAVGNVYVADTDNDTIRKVSPAGVVTTLAGQAGLSGSSDGTGSVARFSHPAGVAADSTGNVFVADTDNDTIRKVSPAGVVTTLAGQAGSAGSADGPAAMARFNGPSGVVVDVAGNLYVADTLNNAIRRITPAGLVTTVYPPVHIASGPRLSGPQGLALDGMGNLYIADTNSNCIQKLALATTTLTSAAGSGSVGSDDGPAVLAQFGYPSGVAVDGTGNLYVADTDNHTVRQITPAGAVSTIAGLAGVSGNADGVGTAARFNYPTGIAVDTTGNIYIADTNNHTIRVAYVPGAYVPAAPAITGQPLSQTVTVGGTVQFSVTVTGKPAPTYQWSFNGTAIAGATGSTLNLPNAQPASAGAYTVTVTNSSGSVTSNAAMLTVNAAAIGSPVSGGAGTSSGGGAMEAWFVFALTSLAMIRRRIPRVRAALLALLPVLAFGQNSGPTYTFTTLAGLAGVVGSTDGTASAARFAGPAGVAVDTAGNIYVADTENSTIRKVAPDGAVSTLAGLAGATGCADGVGSVARFNHPRGVAVDAAGGVYVADGGNATIRKISPDGDVLTLAGLAGAHDIKDGTGSTARFDNPTGVAVDASDNVYVADYTYLSNASFYGTGNIRKITPAGVVTTPPNWWGAEYVAVDTTGNLYAVSTVVPSIARMRPGEAWERIPMNPTQTSGLDAPRGIAVDAAGVVYVSDPAKQQIYKITPDGAMSAIAGGTGAGGVGIAGNADGLGVLARFDGPLGVAVDAAGDVYVTDCGNDTIRKGQPFPANSAPVIALQPAARTATAGQNAAFKVAAASSTTFGYQWQRRPSGSTTWVNLSDGGAYSDTTTATLTVNSITAAMNGDSFRCVVTNFSGATDSEAATLVVVAGPPLIVSTLAGQSGSYGSADGAGTTARFLAPADVAADRAGNVYVADTNNHTIRKIDPGGMVTTLAGQATVSGSADGTGANARFNRPTGVAVDAEDNVYVADTDNDTIRKVTPAGVVTTIAGKEGSAGAADGAGGAARFNSPSGIAADASGNLYVADTLNHLLRRIAPDASVTTLAGQAGVPGQSDGTSSAARFYGPQGLSLDAAGNLYVADTNNNLIRKVVVSTAAVTTLAGQAGIAGDADGSAVQAQFRFPSGLVAASDGNLYVADTDNNAIRRITPAGGVSTVAGLAGAIIGSVDGIGAAARFARPTGITTDAGGKIYIADTDNEVIRAAFFAAPPTITDQPQSQTVMAGAAVQFSVSASGNPAPTYQWCFNGAAIAGATGSTLNLPNAQPANAGSYTVTVTNESGSAASSAVTLTVTAASSGASGTGASAGGGAMGAWLVGLLALFAAARFGAQREPRSVAALGDDAS